MNNRKLIALRSFIIAAGATAAASFVGVFAVMIGASAVEQYVKEAKIEGLSQEFKNDPSFVYVCNFIQYAGTIQLRSGIAKGLEEYAGLLFGVPLLGTMDIIIGAIEEACGKKVAGELIAIFFLLDSNSRKDIIIPFTAASISYIASALIGFMLTEKKSKSIMSKNLLGTLKTLKNNSIFYQYFMATNVQSFFWSLAWPMFPITIVTIMGFSLKVVALLTIAAIGSALVTQYFIAKFIDNINRIPLIFLNKIMLSGIPLMYAFFDSFPLFIGIEIYSGFLGSIQNSILTSYTLDVVPEGHHAEYISILNGFNGAIYFAGALTGGYLLSLFIDFFPLKLALILSYIIVFSGRFISSFLFRGLKEVGGGRNRGALSILFKPRQPGSPSGAPINPR